MALRSTSERALRAYVRALNVADPIRLQFWDDRGLTMPQLRIMFRLLERDGQSAGELAAAMRVTPATMTGLTDRLVKQQLVERHSDTRDGRVVRLFLTPAGRATAQAVEEASRAHLDRVFARMGNEAVDRLIEALREFAHAAEWVQDDLESRA
ncbi:MAG: MarR family transcriptional regulator [Dehalococcoidia bacterium]|nr:MarR family transcriptional regulator [Dehalococcoidia bacterium]MCA9850000.1 MarR family transcriptional regulator [Dehalococcoidia bacterium]MCA9855698.1 MarR family transcriptional regulator [Dehalococcoidia bacterium]